jgi:hypothetical protein
MFAKSEPMVLGRMNDAQRSMDFLQRRRPSCRYPSPEVARLAVSERKKDGNRRRVEVLMSAPDPTDNPVATDVHVAAPGRLEDARRGRRGIVGTVLRQIPMLNRLRGGWERVARTMFRAKRGNASGGRRGQGSAL